ncbi:MAG TPA: hypothetical protein VIY29_09070, partial [Ktedonobacteraceae bacterium]
EEVLTSEGTDLASSFPPRVRRRGSTSVFSRRRGPTPSFELRTHLAQRPVDTTLDGREGLLEQAGDVRDGEVRAEAQGDRLALLGAQDQ